MERIDMKQKGMSLIEVMVAVFILGAGLLGLGGLQARAVMMNQSAFYRSIAADIAADLADRIRANRSPFWKLDTPAVAGAALTVAPDLPLPPDFCRYTLDNKFKASQLPNTVNPANPRQAYLAAPEMQAWAGTVTSLLPNGAYTLVTDANTCAPGPATIGQVLCRYTLTLTWRDDRSTNSDGSYVTVIE